MTSYSIANARIVAGGDPTALKTIETAGRISHASGESVSIETADKFIRMLVRLGHESVLEHHSVTVYVECDRATAQQWTRHRLASYTMLSQRYVDASKDTTMKFIDPEIDTTDHMQVFVDQCESAAAAYRKMRKLGIPPEDARFVLPNAALTAFYTTANLRSWRHFFSERCKMDAQHNIRRLALNLLIEFNTIFPCCVYDLHHKFIEQKID